MENIKEESVVDSRVDSGKLFRRKIVIVTSAISIWVISSLIIVAWSYTSFVNSTKQHSRRVPNASKGDYFSTRDILRLHNAIENSKDIKDLENNINEAISNQVSMHHKGGKLGIQGASIVVSESSVDVKDYESYCDCEFGYISNSDLDEAKYALHIFVDEYTRYPLSIVSNFASEVAFVDHLEMVNDDGTTTEIGGQSSDYIIYNASVIGDEHVGSLSNEIINHEIWHYFDDSVIEDAKLEKDSSDPSDFSAYRDAETKVFAEWVATNVNGIDAYNDYVDSGVELIHPKPGFITDYALADPWEDRAEVFEAMMSPGQRAGLKKFAAIDPILKAKIDLIYTAVDRLGVDSKTELFEH